MNKKGCGCLGVLGIIVVLIIFGSLSEKNKTTPKSNIENIKNKHPDLFIYEDPNSDFNKMSPSEHLSQAKKDLADKSSNWPYGRLSLAKKHLETIKKENDEYKEAQLLLKEIEKKRKLDMEFAKKLGIKLEIENRKNYVKQLELNYLEAGLDIEVSISGKNQTTITLKNILLSRPVIYKLTKDGELLSKFKSLGFKKAVFSDGYNSYTYDLTK
ncbi:MAG: hypothetical protein ACOZFS_05075 [Thermodesulfobacteriota bacterium]